MKVSTASLRIFYLLSLAACCGWPVPGVAGPAPTVLEKGFHLLKTAGPGAAMDVWCDGGVLDDAATKSSETSRLKDWLKPMGNFKSYEVIETREIGRTSKTHYLSLKFERGVLYSSFHVWQSEHDWIIQRMEFNTRPENVMPWLALGGAR